MYEKYVTALQLMDAVVATKDLIKPETGWATLDGTDNSIHPCHRAWDVCFDFIFENFNKPVTAIQPEDQGCINYKRHSHHAEIDLVRPLINSTYRAGGDEIEEVLRGIPPKLAEEIFPVGIARYLFRDIALPLNHGKLRTFEQFHQWYGPMILTN